MDTSKYRLIDMPSIDPLAKEIAIKWIERLTPGQIAIPEKHKLASDFMNYARQNVQEFESWKNSNFRLTVYGGYYPQEHAKHKYPDHLNISFDQLYGIFLSEKLILK